MAGITFGGDGITFGGDTVTFGGGMSTLISTAGTYGNVATLPLGSETSNINPQSNIVGPRLDKAGFFEAGVALVITGYHVISRANSNTLDASCRGVFYNVDESLDGGMGLPTTLLGQTDIYLSPASFQGGNPSLLAQQDVIGLSIPVPQGAIFTVSVDNYEVTSTGVRYGDTNPGGQTNAFKSVRSVSVVGTDPQASWVYSDTPDDWIPIWFDVTLAGGGGTKPTGATITPTINPAIGGSTAYNYSDYLTSSSEASSADWFSEVDRYNFAAGDLMFCWLSDGRVTLIFTSPTTASIL